MKFWALVGVLGLAACDGDSTPPASKAAQCRALLDVIAEHENRGGKSDSDVPDALMKSAVAVEKAGAAVADVALQDPKIVDFRRRYADMARDLGLTARDTAFATAKGDAEEQTRAAARLSTSRAVEHNLRAEMRSYCTEAPTPTGTP